MKLNRFFLLPLLLACCAASPAWANHGHFYRPHAVFYLSPWPLVYPVPAVYPVIVQETPIVYVERDPASITDAPNRAQPAAPVNDWFYCKQPDGYYPYVKKCPSGWQRVPSQPVLQQ